MMSLPQWIVVLAVRRLPAEHRDRYRGELQAELHFLTGWSRLGYALRILVLAPALRACLDGGAPALAEATPAWPHERLWCWARLHRTNPLPLSPPPRGHR